MADIQNGYSLTKKVGQDLLTVQGTDYATFKANVEALYGSSEVLGAFVPLTDPAAVEAALQPSTPAPVQAAPVAAAPAAAPNGEAATQKQQDFLWKVAGERNLGRTEVLNVAAQVTNRHIDTVGELTKREASAVIDALKG